MYPLIGKINLYTVDVIDFFILIDLFHFGKDGIYINFRGKIHTVLCDKIRRISSTQLTHRLSFMSQMTQEKSNTYQSIAPIVAGRINHSTITFTTNHGIGSLHLSHHIDFTHSRSTVFHSIFASHVAQCTGRAQIRNSITRSMFQHIIGHSHQRIFFTIHHTVLTNHSQAVNIRVYHKSHVCLTTFHKVHNITQILLKRFGVMGKITGRFAIKFLHMLYTEAFEQFGKNNTSDRIHTVDSHAEISFPDSFHVHQIKR